MGQRRGSIFAFALRIMESLTCLRHFSRVPCASHLPIFLTNALSRVSHVLPHRLVPNCVFLLLCLAF